MITVQIMLRSHFNLNDDALEEPSTRQAEAGGGVYAEDRRCKRFRARLLHPVQPEGCGLEGFAFTAVLESVKSLKPSGTAQRRRNGLKIHCKI